MASLTIAFPPVTTGRVYAATAAKSGGASKQEKGFLDWLVGSLNKEESMREVDPILNKVEEKGTTTSSGSKGTTTSGGRKGGTVSVPPKKNGGGGFGGLFAKK